MTRILMACTLVAATVFASSAKGTVVFVDAFNEENGGVEELGYTDFLQWTVSNGIVDLIGGTQGELYPSNGLYVDLGSATLTSDPIAIAPGTYELSFSLGLIPGSGPNSMKVTFGPYSETFEYDPLNVGTPPDFKSPTRTIEITSAASLSIVFDHSGVSNAGFIIDDVFLTAVPEASAFSLMGVAAVGACGVWRLRRRSRLVG